MTSLLSSFNPLPGKFGLEPGTTSQSMDNVLLLCYNLLGSAAEMGMDAPPLGHTTTSYTLFPFSLGCMAMLRHIESQFG